MQDDKPKMNFESQGLTLDDISFDETETVDFTKPETPEVELEEIKTVVEEEQPGKKKETKKVEKQEELPVVKPTTLEDLEDSLEDETDAVKKEDKDIYLQAAKGILQKKLDRYNISSSVNIDDLSEEELVEFEEELDKEILDSRYESLKQVDKNVKTILDYIEVGGDPKKIAKLFEEQQTISKIDTSTTQGKINLIKTYYSEVHGWDESKVIKKIERLQATNTLDDELSDVEESYNEYFERRVEEEQIKQQEEEQRKIAIENRRYQTFTENLQGLQIDKKLKKDMLDVAVGKGSLNGNTIDILDYKIMEFQADPNKFIKLVHFLTSPDNYDDFIKQQKQNQTVIEQSKKGFSFQPKKVTPDNTQVKTSNKQDSKPKFNFN